ncbi:tRNA pseudouridine(13) synthase TruD [Marinospirillum insulare]|uniref:tRNA pseudouridine synthase D n=1 Tax=Marinospirillum insulare TaxID=217169 RepID=A0ABQ5ZU69_9GAMM|nr:tRNA pseudouridine(13) synthase TruD [Marinospirillum insulare]GLR63711.1 tRNA pseudouridine synthase D [Marinospirillum insulare]
MQAVNNSLENQLAQLESQLTQLPSLFPSSPWQGVYRLEPEDFQVEEVLGFEPEGQGEHLYLWVEKKGSNTAFVAQELARSAGVHPSAVAYSGLKDRQAITRQWFSLHLPGQADPSVETLNSANWQVLKMARHPRKLKRGTHRSNRFTLRLRVDNTDDTTGHWLEKRWQQITQQGVPNYFGPQRFGRGGQNIHKALSWLMANPPIKPPKRQEKSIYLSALRSALFNAWLAETLNNQHWIKPLQGSCFNLEGTRSYFSDPTATDLSKRLASGDINLAGPLAGKGHLQSSGLALQAEEAFREAYLPYWQALANQGLKVEYRPLRMQPKATEFNWQAPWLTLGFTLPSGCFATSLLAELINANDAQIN